MGGGGLLLLLAALLGGGLLLFALEAALQLFQGLHQAVRALAHTGRVTQHLLSLGGQFLRGILQFHFRHSTLAPPQLFADFIG